jgi:hypothetical protein
MVIYLSISRHWLTNSMPWLTNPMPWLTNSRPWLTLSRHWVTNSRPWLTNSRPWLTNSRPWLTNSRPWLNILSQCLEIVNPCPFPATVGFYSAVCIYWFLRLEYTICAFACIFVNRNCIWRASIMYYVYVWTPVAHPLFSWPSGRLKKVCSIPGPLASVVCNLIGYRGTCILGSLLASSGYLISAFTNSLELLFFSYGCLIGMLIAAVVVFFSLPVFCTNKTLAKGD